MKKIIVPFFLLVTLSGASWCQGFDEFLYLTVPKDTVKVKDYFIAAFRVKKEYLKDTSYMAIKYDDKEIPIRNGLALCQFVAFTVYYRQDTIVPQTFKLTFDYRDKRENIVFNYWVKSDSTTFK